MLGMTIPTFAIGLIPGYNEIGYIAPLLLAIASKDQNSFRGVVSVGSEMEMFRFGSDKY